MALNFRILLINYIRHKMKSRLCTWYLTSIIFIFNLLLYYSSIAQTFIIFKDDTLFKKVIDTIFVNNIYFIREYKFKDSLPDGNYFVYNINRPKSSNSKIHSFLILKGVFRNLQRNGVFEYYQSDENNNKSKEADLIVKENYKNGLLNGTIIKYKNKHLIYEGYYSNGLKEGFFRYYDSEGRLQSNSFYINGKEVSWMYYKDSIVSSYGNNLNNDTTEVKLFDKKENIWALIIFYNNIPKKTIEYYENGNIKCLKEGLFKISNDNAYIDLMQLVKSPLISGRTINYDENMKIISVIDE